MSDLRFTCSPRPRPSYGTSRTKQWWAREVFHVRWSGIATYCGRDCSDWLDIDAEGGGEEMLSNHNCCKRCAKRVRERHGLSAAKHKEGLPHAD